MDFGKGFFNGRDMFFSGMNSREMPSMEDLIEGHKNFNKQDFSSFKGLNFRNGNFGKMGDNDDLDEGEFKELFEKRVKAFRELGLDI